jgi:hypothetical protein
VGEGSAVAAAADGAVEHDEEGGGDERHKQESGPVKDGGRRALRSKAMDRSCILRLGDRFREARAESQGNSLHLVDLGRAAGDEKAQFGDDDRKEEELLIEVQER